MRMDRERIRDRVRDIFAARRESPNAWFDEEHFLDFLLENPKNRGAVTNSFKGLRRRNAFLDEVQADFRICFSLAEFDWNWSFEGFTSMVCKKAKSRAANVNLIRKRIRETKGRFVSDSIKFSAPAIAVAALLSGLCTTGHARWAVPACAGLLVIILIIRLELK